MPNDQGSHNCSMLGDLVELSEAVSQEAGVVDMKAGMAADMVRAGEDHIAGNGAVEDTVVNIAAGTAVDSQDSRILADVGNAAAIVRP